MANDHRDVLTELIASYRQGPAVLRRAVDGMTGDQLRARPVPGRWGTLEVVCHIADMEIVYAERIRRIVAEEQPILFDADPDRFASGLCYHDRVLETELEPIDAIRRQTAILLEALPEDTWERTGRHSVTGPVTLRQIVENITAHIPHHVTFIYEKRRALGLPEAT